MYYNKACHFQLMMLQKWKFVDVVSWNLGPNPTEDGIKVEKVYKTLAELYIQAERVSQWFDW